MAEKCYVIPNIDCTACAIAIEAALEEVSGVERAEVNVNRREVSVSFDEVRVQEPQIEKALTEAGYPPTDKSPKANLASGEVRPEGNPPSAT